MIQAGTGISGEKKSEKAAALAASDAVKHAGINESDLALVFVTTQHSPHYLQILKTVQSVTGARQIVGTSGYGVLTEKMQIEHAHGISVMTLQADSFETNAFLIPDLQENNLEGGRAIGRHIQGRGFAKNLFCIFPDPFSLRSPSFFQGLMDEAGETPLIGGLSAEDGSQRMTYQFAGDRVACDAASGFLFSGNFRFSSNITQSCVPASSPMKISKTKENLIFKLDGKPAYDQMLEVLDTFEINDLSTLMNFLFVGLPILPEQSEFSHGNYIVRNIIGVDPEKKCIAIGGPAPERENMVFLIRDPGMAKQDMSKMLDDAENSLIRYRFGLYFPSSSRGINLYNKPHVETKMIRERFPKIPIAGFFSYGELAPVQGINVLHNYSGVLTLIGE